MMRKGERDREIKKDLLMEREQKRVRKPKAVGQALRNFLNVSIGGGSGSCTIVCAYWPWWIWSVRTWGDVKRK